MDKILIVRFSSIGDIVLTTPVIRALHKLANHPEIHYITKKKFANTLIHNPYIDKLYTFDKEITEISQELKSEGYTYIIDLHSNLRSKRLKLMLSSKSQSFNKINIKKWLKVKLKYDRLPNVHIVDRYLDTLSFLGVTTDGEGLDYFISTQDENVGQQFQERYPKGYHCFVIGGAHFTKQIPALIINEVADNSKLPIVLLGGPEDRKKGEQILRGSRHEIYNACGEYSLNESAAIIKNCQKVLTSDTGMMHIASAYQKEILSVWGNTIPEFGMFPYFAKEQKNKNHIFEVKDLNCRPCSKIGYSKCPKLHFDCMLKIDVKGIIDTLNS
jgi:ADP-heptose:LPS heptosyltransferase